MTAARIAAAALLAAALAACAGTDPTAPGFQARELKGSYLPSVCLPDPDTGVISCPDDATDTTAVAENPREHEDKGSILPSV
jgi:hypothetical protein